MAEPGPEAESSPKSGLRSLVSCALLLALVAGGGLIAREVLAPKPLQLSMRQTSDGYHLEVEGRPTVIPIRLGPECSEPRVEAGRSEIRLTWVARGVETSAYLYANEGDVATYFGGPSLADGESLVLLPGGDFSALAVGESVQVEVFRGELGGERAKFLVYGSDRQAGSFVSVELLVDDLPLGHAPQSSFLQDGAGWEFMATIGREVYGVVERAGTVTYSRISRGKNLGTTVLESAWRGPLEELPADLPEVEASAPKGRSG